MWTRGDLKANAKDVLRGVYWKALVVSLIVMIAQYGAGSGTTNNKNFINFDFKLTEFLNISPEIIRDNLFPAMTIAFVVGTIIAAAILFRVLLGYQLEVGGRRFFIKAAIDRESQIENLMFTFKNGRYGNVIKTMLMKSISIICWTLLLIFPGIIRYYAYRMVPYILADNPHITSSRALEISDHMTLGHKWDMFVLDLSFIGWYILGALALGIGTIFVHPYVDATYAELYLKLKQNAIDKGLCGVRELTE